MAVSLPKVAPKDGFREFNRFPVVLFQEHCPLVAVDAFGPVMSKFSDSQARVQRTGYVRVRRVVSMDG